jgi:hypothetical protein
MNVVIAFEFEAVVEGKWMTGRHGRQPGLQIRFRTISGSRIRIHIKVKSWIRINVMPIRNTAVEAHLGVVCSQ